MNLQEQIQICYQHFYIKFCGVQNYLFVPKESEIKSINRITKWFDENYGKFAVGTNMIFDFCAYQFYFYSKPNAIQSKRYIHIGHIIGEKAIERWINKNQNELQKALLWTSQIGVLITDLNEIINYQEPVSFNALEETERKRFHNTEFGLMHCLTLTKGYSKNSEYCKLCKWSVKCREMKV